MLVIDNYLHPVFPTMVREGNLVRRAHLMDKLIFWFRGDKLMPKAVNYSPELTAQIVEAYQGGASVEDIAADVGKAVRSVRSKLVREQVYVAPEKGEVSKREQGPTKKELLVQLNVAAPIEIHKGFDGMTKAAVEDLILYFSDQG